MAWFQLTHCCCHCSPRLSCCGSSSCSSSCSSTSMSCCQQAWQLFHVLLELGWGHHRRQVCRLGGFVSFCHCQCKTLWSPALSLSASLIQTLRRIVYRAMSNLKDKYMSEDVTLGYQSLPIFVPRTWYTWNCCHCWCISSVVFRTFPVVLKCWMKAKGQWHCPGPESPEICLKQNIDYCHYCRTTKKTS